MVLQAVKQIKHVAEKAHKKKKKNLPSIFTAEPGILRMCDDISLHLIARGKNDCWKRLLNA